MPFQVKIPPGLRNIDITQSKEGEKENAVSTKSVEETAEAIISSAKEEAKLIIKEAELEAAKILESSKKEADENKSAVFEEAWQKGYEQGTREGKSQYESLIKEAEEKKKQAQREYSEILASVEADVVNTILDIARKVVGTELTSNKDSILHMVKQAFEKCTNRETIILCINDVDYDHVIQNKEKLMSMVNGVHELEIRKDAALKAGDFLVRTPYGNVDGSMETKLRKIEEAFREVICD